MITEVEVRNCHTCGVELNSNNWKSCNVKIKQYRCTPCHDKLNRKRMFVNGKYIPFEHPLYKPGRYKTFNDAAFAALQKDIKVKEGYVYAICNPAWPEWVKIGMAIDADDRLNGYQTSSPMRDYTLIHTVFFEDRGKAERAAHKEAGLYGDRLGEWFKITKEEAILVLESGLDI